jgi:hypoxia up-regulated 1
MEIALNPESKRKTSVAVSLKDGERKFGSDAMGVCVKSPKHCYVYLLDLLGKKVGHPLVESYKKRFPQYAIEADKERGTVLFRHDESTVYSVEELLGMVFAHAKTQAETFTEQTIKDAVITVPVYFNQAERLALVAAAQLGGLSVLQLMNVPSAVALNYGMFRRKEINGTVKHLMLYDMGAQQTTATIVGFQIVKTKDKGFSETHPQAQVLGVGYDRTLGGQEIRFRIREYLADEFNALGKTKTDVRSVPRAMGKLLKESERVKLILSANTDCFAQIENVMEDIDFKIPVSREKLLELSADLMERVTSPVQAALNSASMTMESIDQVILVGGGTRVPKVQELLQQFVGQELGKSLNTDESAAMGAVYRAADLSTGFKVKKFLTKDAVIFPIDVDFERVLEEDEGTPDSPGVKKVRRTLFSRMNPFPQKKIMTFNKHQQDFTFNVNYADVNYLGATEVANLGSLNLTSVLVKGVKESLEKNTGDNIETKGVKAHFQLDDSGILSVTSVESVFEKTISPEEQEKEEVKKDGKDDTIDWSKLGDTISNFFGTEDKKEDGEEIKSEEQEKEDKKSDKKADKKEKDKKDDKKKDSKEKEKEKPKEPKKPKIETIKNDLESVGTRNDLELLDGDTFDNSKAKLAALNQADLDRIARETALNELQSLSFDLQDKMYQEDHESASTETERETIAKECSQVSDWLDEEAGVDTSLDEFTSRIKVLKDLAAPILARVREHNGRPEALAKLEQVFETSNNFLEKSKDKTGEDGLFKEKELEALKKKIEEVKKWREDKLAEQEKTPLSEMPKLTVSMINQKVYDLESEVQFLIQKAKMVKAEQERAKRKAEAEAKKAEEEKKKKEKKEKKAKEAKEANETDTAEEKKIDDSEGSSEAPSGDKEPATDTTEEKPESDAPETKSSESDESSGTSDDEPKEKVDDHEEL